MSAPLVLGHKDVDMEVVVVDDGEGPETGAVVGALGNGAFPVNPQRHRCTPETLPSI